MFQKHRARRCRSCRWRCSLPASVLSPIAEGCASNGTQRSTRLDVPRSARRPRYAERWGPLNGETCLGPHTATCVAFVHHLPVSGFAVASAGVGRLRSLSSVRATAEPCWLLDRPTRQSPEAVSQGPEGSPVLLSGLGSAVTAKLPVSCECYF